MKSKDLSSFFDDRKSINSGSVDEEVFKEAIKFEVMHTFPLYQIVKDVFTLFRVNSTDKNVRAFKNRALFGATYCFIGLLLFILFVSTTFYSFLITTNQNLYNHYFKK